MEPIWQLGPAGNLRPLICPERDVDVTSVRHGGIHENLSGARVMDVTGHRQNITMSFSYLTPAEARWLRALHFRQLPGPYRLLSPLHKNRLSPEGSMCKAGTGTRRGIIPEKGVLTRDFDVPSAFVGDYLGMSSKWTNRLANWPVRWDSPNRTTVIAGEQLTFSVYQKAAAVFNVTYGIDWWDRAGAIVTASSSIKATTTAWSRWSSTITVPAGAVIGRMFAFTANATDALYFAGAQIESGPTATQWEIGGGAPVVVLDQMTEVSPHFGHTTHEITLLEV